MLLEESGWELKPEGLCLEDRCIPVGSAAVVQDEAHGLTAIGPPSGGRALPAGAKLPDLVLPDRNGRPFSLHSLRGTRFVMIAWASW